MLGTDFIRSLDRAIVTGGIRIDKEWSLCLSSVCNVCIVERWYVFAKNWLWRGKMTNKWGKMTLSLLGQDDIPISLC